MDLGADYTVRVKVLPENASISEWFGKIGIANQNNEYLWAITIWYVPGGVQEEQYRTAVVMDRMLGGRAPQADDNICYGAYFQWGRPFPFSWGSGTFGSAATTARDLKQSAKNVDKVLYYKDVENANGDWWLGDQTGQGATGRTTSGAIRTTAPEQALQRTESRQCSTLVRRAGWWHPLPS